MMAMEEPGEALTAPAVARNRDAILAVLRGILPASGLVLEVASGSGEHAVHLAGRLPGLNWQPSDREPAALRSITAHARIADLRNLLAPISLDASGPPWPVERADAVLAINMIHISPWAATEGLMAGAAALLPEGGPLVLYGPFRERDRETAPSNEAFDADLRSRDPSWGLRDRDAVAACASAQGLDLADRIEMPANNLVLVFRRRRGATR